MDVLNAAHKLDDLRSPPGNRLEALKGDLVGFHSIRVMVPHCTGMISPTPLRSGDFGGLLSAGMTVYTMFHW